MTATNGKLASLLAEPTRDGYTFKGWYDTLTDGNEITTDTTFSGDTVVYAQWTKNLLVHDGEKTAETTVIASEIIENASVALPEIPEHMSYGEPVFNEPLTSAAVSNGNLVFSTSSDTQSGESYEVTIHVTGSPEAEYQDYNIHVTISAIECLHPNKSNEWISDEQGHWHICPDCSNKVDYEEHISSGAATEDTDEHCTVCGYVIAPQLNHVCANNKPTFIPEVAASCTTDGVKAHYLCRCGKHYADEAATIEVTEADLIIAAHHTWSESLSYDKTNISTSVLYAAKRTKCPHTFMVSGK